MKTLPAVDGLMAIDIGNTRIGMTLWDADGVHDTRRVALSEPGGWASAIETTWGAGARTARRGVVIASVVPEQTARVQQIAERVSGCAAARVRDDIPLPMPLMIENALEVGVDRVCSAAAAFERVREACAVASFGSAITIDCVSAEGAFLGGAILPGLELSLAALHERTAALPRVALSEPGGRFGRNTHDAILNGVVMGAVGALREIVEGFATELNRWPQLILTGGNAGMIAARADFVDAVVPDLCLMGIALAYRRAAGQT